MDDSGVSLPIWRAAIWSMEMPASGPYLVPVGAWQVSQVASMMPCGSELSPGLLRMPAQAAQAISPSPIEALARIEIENTASL